MLERILGIEDGGQLQFRAAWSSGVLALLVALAVAFALLLYSRERALPFRMRLLLGGLRAVLYALLLTLLFEPVLTVGRTVLVPSNVLVLADVSESMNIRDPRRGQEELREAALALGKVPFSSPALSRFLQRP